MQSPALEQTAFLEKLLGLCARCRIQLSDTQALRCYEHVALMLEWNRRMNLTRITSPDEIIEKHLLDSLIPARWLPNSGRAMDIGSGAGFPGIPLKILHPKLDMDLVDTHRKKTSFLRVVIARLELGGIRSVQGRWEDLRRPSPGHANETFDLITLRAIRLQETETIKLAEGRLKPGGILAYWSGINPPDASGCITVPSGRESPIVRQEVHTYRLPSGSRPRYLRIWKTAD